MNRNHFTSVPAVASRLVPVLPMAWLLGDRFDNLAKAPDISVPTLVVHGDRDGVVPYAMGVALAERIRGAELLTVPGAGHNDLLERGGARIFDALSSDLDD